MPRPKNHIGGDQEGLRQVNLSAVLTNLRQNAPLSRTALAELTGLNKATITRLVHDLIQHGLVREVGFKSSITGRPSILLELDPDGGFIIGVGIEVDSCSVILTDFAAEILWRRDEPIERNGELDSLVNCVTQITQEAYAQAEKAGRPVLGLGLSAPGLVDASQGTLLFAPNLGLQNIPLRKYLEEQFPFPIYVDNEANMAALGESYFGSARDCDYGLYIDITAGVGAGIVMNQRILPGVSGLAGEVGHMTINPEGPRCNCGNYGCWEIYVNLPSIFRRVTEAVSAGHPSVLSDAANKSPQELTIQLVVDAAQDGDPAALNALQETGHYIGIGVANLINAFNPSRIVLGGYLSLAYEYMLPEINRVVRERALRWPVEAAKIVIAAYGSDARLMGAIATVYDHVLLNPVEAITQSLVPPRTERRSSALK